MLRFLSLYPSTQLLAPFLQLSDLLQFNQCSRNCYQWIQRLQQQKFLHCRVMTNLRLLLPDDEQWERFLSMWKGRSGEPGQGTALYLTGSTLLWCLEPHKRWKPNDFDVVVFQSREQVLPSLPGATNIHDLLNPEPYEFQGEWRTPMDGVRQAVQRSPDEKNTWKRLHYYLGPKFEFHEDRREKNLPLIDVVLRIGDAKTSVWTHLKGFDMGFVQNAWRPDGLLVIFDTVAVASREAVNVRSVQLKRELLEVKENTKEWFWIKGLHDHFERRIEKYRLRGFCVHSELTSSNRGVKRKKC